MKKLLPIILLGLYIGGGVKFWNGFSRTNFNQNVTTRIILSLLWPVLFAGNKSFRGNFQKALKGS
ncbi:MAG: hypothetical protein EAZ61_01585 [Oscillatoriales cyanobacterium]|nr:MAG: hypothetical protein EAZ61_01585 [Oscillatoriales cyanobacterium]